MTLDLTYFESDLTNVIADLPVEVNHYGNIFNAMIGNTSETADVGFGGFATPNTFSLGCLVSSFTRTPEPKQQIKVGGISYIIMDVSKSADAIQYDLTIATEEADVSI